MSEELHKLGEVLRSAREAKGVDLARVERDTKIRSRYLSALEGGEYRDLPGAVYTKGFLRNYGLYLGLDPEYLIDLYRLEYAAVAAERPAAPTPPRPIATKRARAFVVTPGAVVAAILTIGVGALVVWLSWGFVNFARQPDLRIIEPAGDVARHPETSYLVRGVTAPNARITVDGLRENPSVTADEEGTFSVMVGLVPGSNVLRVIAYDPVTRRDSETVSRTITVSELGASPSPGGAVSFGLDQPAADAALASPVPISGRSAPNAQVQVTATLIEPATPSFALTDAAGAAIEMTPQAPSPPEPLVMTAAADGAFSGELALPPGTWDLSVAPGIPEADAVTRRVAVQEPAGLAGTLRIGGGQSYLEVEQDGEPLEGVSGGISDPGVSVQLSAQAELRIRSGNASAVELTLNGFDLGAMGAPGAVVQWTITRADG
ncbi:MAG: RodZ domain-containing protein [Candidatus Limnocylindria bacterium]